MEARGKGDPSDVDLGYRDQTKVWLFRPHNVSEKWRDMKAASLRKENQGGQVKESAGTNAFLREYIDGDG